MIGIFAASVGALEIAPVDPRNHPWWSLAIFAMRVWILHGLFLFSGTVDTAAHEAALAGGQARFDGGATTGAAMRR